MPNLQLKNYKYYYIYKISNLINKKCYVGFHATHKEYDQDSYFGSGGMLKLAINKYGIDNFIMGIIEYIRFEEWQEKEQYWIHQLHSHISEWGYNMTYGGDGTLGYVWNDAQRKTIGAVNLNKKRSDETKEKMKLSAKNRPAQSQETKTLRVKSLQGLKRTEEAKKNYKNSKLGNKNPMKTYEYSDDQREKFKLNAINQEKKTCEYCGREFFIRHYKQYHGEKCKDRLKILKESLIEEASKD